MVYKLLTWKAICQLTVDLYRICTNWGCYAVCTCGKGNCHFCIILIFFLFQVWRPGIVDDESLLMYLRAARLVNFNRWV